MMILGISGKAKAGKDLFFAIYQSRGFFKASFAKSLKDRVRRDFSLTEEHVNGWLKDSACAVLNNKSPRELLIDYGNLFRKYNPEYWVDELLGSLKEYPGHYMITDVRFPNEADQIRRMGGLLIRLERHPDREKLMDQEQLNSKSETALDEYLHFDLVLPAEENRTPHDLEVFALKVDELIQTIEQNERTKSKKS